VTPVRHALVSSSSASWTPIGPNPIVNSIYGGNVSGRITGIAISSVSPSKIFAASAGGGVWASDNSGVSWATSTDSQPDIAMGAVSVDPMNSQVVFAGTGEDNFCGDCHPGAGVLESVDGGKSWTDSNPNDVFTGQTIGSIIFEPGARLLSRTTVLVAASGGLYVSHDGGVSWNIESGSGWQNGHVTSVVINALTPQVAIYAWVCGVGLEASPDNGNTWEVIDTTGASESLGRGSLAIIPSGLSSQITLYDSIGSDAGYIGMMKSTDGGVTWNLLDSCTDPLQTNCIPYFTSDDYAYSGKFDGGGGDQSLYDNVVSVDPANPNIVVAGGETIIESLDGGLTWTNLNGSNGFWGSSVNRFHPDIHALAFDARGNLYVGCDGGVWNLSANAVSAADGSQFKNLNANLDISQFYPGISVVGDGAIITGGTQDNGSVIYRNQSGLGGSWATTTSGDGGSTIIGDTTGSLLFTEGNVNGNGCGSPSGLYVATDGVAFSPVTLPPQSNCNWFARTHSKPIASPTSQVTTTHIPGSSTVVEEIRAGTTMS